ncbi:hypothetical protein ACIQPT_21630 [Streptomyces sp. NPDC091289]|uniref:hypothetical protein n=1 Tax=Streptomyces sp. NPDC091289 TaxID=3365989 RepID=UPI003816856F
MESWSDQHVQALLEEGEQLESAFPVRYPWGGLPFGWLLRGCVIALTDHRIVAFAHHKVTSRPDGQIWSEPRSSGCTAELSGNARRLTLTRPEAGRLELVVAPRHTRQIRRLIDALTA